MGFVGCLISSYIPLIDCRVHHHTQDQKLSRTLTNAITGALVRVHA